MKTSLLNIKVDPKTKQQAQKIAGELGFSLSTIVHGYLKQFVKEKTIHFSLTEARPSQRLLTSIKQAEEDRKQGKTHQFSSTKEAVAFLKKKK